MTVTLTMPGPAVLLPLIAMLASLAAAWPVLRPGAARRLRLSAGLFLGLTALWAGLLAASAAGWSVPAWAPELADLFRMGASVGTLVLMLGLLVRFDQAGGGPALLAGALGLLMVLALGDLALSAATGEPQDEATVGAVDVALVARLGLGVLGLLLVENLFRHSRDAGRWAVKHMLVGLGAVFAFDLYAMADAQLFRSVDRPAADVRPMLVALVAPLIAVSLRRLPNLRADIALSRTVLLHTTALVGAGIYLLAVAVVGFALKRSDMAWAEVGHFALLFGAVLVLAVLLLSTEAKARMRHLMSRHFFPLTYDYRREWLRFIGTMAQDSADASLYQRAVRALADVFDCSGGALFLCQRGEVFVQVARHQWSSAASLIALPAPILTRLREQRQALDLMEARREAAADAAVLDWFAKLDRPWLAVPLFWRDELLGVVLLGQPRAPRPLGWEERDLLQVLGEQVASYLREDQASRALAVAQRFERTGRRFTFVAHDVKTIVSQLGLVVAQAEKHGDNPEFMADALDTVRHAVDRMHHLLVRLRDTPDGSEGRGRLDLRGLLEDVAARKRRLVRSLELEVRGDPPPVAADPVAVAMVIENLIQNAVEAADGDVGIGLTLTADGHGAVLEVSDDGPGMTRSFVETALFTPFASTKESGFGIGMYQCRCLAEEWGGDLTLDTEPGRGTRIRLRFPAAAQGPDAAAPAGRS